MLKNYKILNAITLNVTGNKYNAIATPTNKAEIVKHKAQFGFNFIALPKDAIVYKIHLENEPNIIQGLVAFRHELGALHCLNMETNYFNKKAPALYSGIGRLIVTFCCKYSLDNGMYGFIYFEAKNRLMPYYARLGAENVYGLRMCIDETAAKKLINYYF